MMLSTTLRKTSLHMTTALTAMSLMLSSVPAYSMSLDEALVTSYNTNPRIKAERKNLETLDERVNQAFSGWRPTVQADYSKGRQYNSVNDAAEVSSDTESKTLSVTQPLFRGGGTIASTSSAKYTVKAGQQNLKNLEQQVLLEAATAYLNVVRDQAVTELSRNNVDVLKKQLQASRDRFEVGEVTRTDVSQSEARLAQAESDAVNAEGALMSSRATFARVVGAPAEALTIPKAFPAVPANLEEAVEVAMANNPNIVAGEYTEKAAGKDVNSTIAQLLPTVDLVGAMSRSEGGGLVGESDLDSDSLRVNVAIPLYQSGAEYSRVREAYSRESQRKFDLKNAQDQTREQVTQAWENLQTSIATIRAQEASIKAAEVALDGVSQEQLYGARTVLDVLDAEQELFVSRVNLVRAERNRATAIFSLLGTMGKLTVGDLDLETAAYNPDEHYDDVKYQFIGF